MNHNWVTFHCARFAASMNALDGLPPPPDGPSIWRYCPRLATNTDGLPTLTAEVWGALAVHENEDAARTFFAAPEAAFAPFREATENWHALAIPIAHHGVVKWGDAEEDGTALVCASGVKEGRLAVVTTAGYTDREAAEPARIKAFLSGIQQVVGQYSVLEGNLYADVFSGGFDGRDGYTLTLWNDDREMIRAAYKSGTHKSQMEIHAETSLFDRSSFSRLRVLETRGTMLDEGA